MSKVQDLQTLEDGQHSPNPLGGQVTLQARKLKGIAEEKFEESKEQIVDLENKIASEQIESGNNIIIK